ncbi:hypothetical protein [Microbacterium hominis]|uniref:hypothetical protein n=1 Tax=Microbacterium hominis TaxID=162426 RepID=UPI001CC31EBF|nr:hypothetical protein [Microbacterium hominis]
MASSAPTAPTLQVPMSVRRASVPTATQLAFGTSTAVASASTAAHAGSTERCPRSPVIGSRRDGLDPEFQKTHTQVVAR